MKTQQVLNWTLEKQSLEEQIRKNGNTRLLLSNEIKSLAAKRHVIQVKIDTEIKGWGT